MEWHTLSYEQLKEFRNKLIEMRFIIDDKYNIKYEPIVFEREYMNIVDESEHKKEVLENKKIKHKPFYKNLNDKKLKKWEK